MFNKRIVIMEIKADKGYGNIEVSMQIKVHALLNATFQRCSWHS